MRGFSLIEAILATFMLVGAFYTVSRLFHTGLQFSTSVEHRLTAVHLAEKRMSELRRWADTAAGWTGYPNTARDPDFPNFTIGVRVLDRDMLSPCRELENAHPGNQRVMQTASRRVNVTISWGESSEYQLGGILTKKPRGWRATDPITISGTIPASLGPPPAEVFFTARAFDSANREIDDIFFHWTIEPVYTSNPATALITMEQRDGKRVKVENQVRRRNGEWHASTGECRLACYAVLDGTLKKVTSEPIRLVP